MIGRKKLDQGLWLVGTAQ